MALKVYVDRLPSLHAQLSSSAKFEEVRIELGKGQHRTPEFAEVNPMKQVPAIAHGDFKLFESHAILIYLASAFPGVADHWYPADVKERAKVHSLLDWHHSNLRRGSVGLVFNTTIGLAFGLPQDPKAAAEGEKLLSASLDMIESYWLGDGPFLLGKTKPSIADLALACEVLQIEIGDDSDRERILVPRKKILKWIEHVKAATAPHFEELHAIIAPAKGHFDQLKAQLSQKSA